MFYFHLPVFKKKLSEQCQAEAQHCSLSPRARPAGPAESAHGLFPSREPPSPRSPVPSLSLPRTPTGGPRVLFLLPQGSRSPSPVRRRRPTPSPPWTLLSTLPLAQASLLLYIARPRPRFASNRKARDPPRAPRELAGVREIRRAPPPSPALFRRRSRASTPPSASPPRAASSRPHGHAGGPPEPLLAQSRRRCRRLLRRRRAQPPR